jgi:hypothetical protein
VHYEVEVVETIPLSPAGKFQTIVPFEGSKTSTSEASGSG